MKKAIIIGATSGIGKSLSKILSKNNYCLGLVGRRKELLKSLQNKISSETFIETIDVTKTTSAIKKLKSLIKKMGGLDLIVISSAVSHRNKDLIWDEEKETVETNILGFLAMANTAVEYFSKKKKGCIVGISSIAGMRCSSRSTAYCASKAFISNYLRGLRQKLKNKKLNIHVTEVIPGFVDTPMIKRAKIKFWVASPKKAAIQIYSAIKKKKEKVYITKRWRLVGWLLKVLPDKIKKYF